MELRDVIVAPVILCFIYIGAFLIRPFVTDGINRRYFLPALTVRVIGALSVGFIYQFYYHGGDTFNFHTHGSRHIWEAFMDSPATGLKLMFSGGTYDESTFRYAIRIPFYRDASSYVVIRIAAFFDLFTFSAYTGTALCFAVISFIGSWCLFKTFYSPGISWHRSLAVVTLFIPSVFFWGGGLLKDTITLACLGTSTYLIKRIFIKRRVGLMSAGILLVSIYFIFLIKKYILLCFLPAAVCWIFVYHLSAIRLQMLRLMVLPFVLAITIVVGYFAIQQVGKNDERYNLDALASTARITAYDIAFMTGIDAGSTYSLGELDGSFGSMARLAPQAVNVALFRPYLWEVRNPLMLMTALESLVFLLFTVFVVFKCRSDIFKALADPNIIFCLVFSITFAFAVGVSTFNFGSLSRYKIPLMPFFGIALTLLYHSRADRKALHYSMPFASTLQDIDQYPKDAEVSPHQHR